MLSVTLHMMSLEFVLLLLLDMVRLYVHILIVKQRCFHEVVDTEESVSRDPVRELLLVSKKQPLISEVTPLSCPQTYMAALGLCGPVPVREERLSENRAVFHTSKTSSTVDVLACLCCLSLIMAPTTVLMGPILQPALLLCGPRCG